MEEEQVIFVDRFSKIFAAEALDTLTEQNEFYTIDITLSPDNFFGMQIKLEVVAIDYRKDDGSKTN